MTGRLGNILPSSARPARPNIAAVPVNTAGGEVFSAATSTGWPSSSAIPVPALRPGKRTAYRAVVALEVRPEPLKADQAVNPPSTVIDVPVRYRPSGPAR
ncbi:hypothetical protein A4R44_06151 [Amycolatopsis sp. M39]|nr:hypothetical protein A4R44_06151 [Amycolatopsis sp. M39]